MRDKSSQMKVAGGVKPTLAYAGQIQRDTPGLKFGAVILLAAPQNWGACKYVSQLVKIHQRPPALIFVGIPRITAGNNFTRLAGNIYVYEAALLLPWPYLGRIAW